MSEVAGAGTPDMPATKARPRTGLLPQSLVSLGVVTLLAVIVSSLLALWMVGEGLRSQRERSAQDLASTAAIIASKALDPRRAIDDPVNRDSLTDVLRLLTERGEIVAASVIRPDRRVVAALPPRASDDEDPPVAVAVLGGLSRVLNYRLDERGEQQLLAYAPVTMQASVVGAIRLVFRADLPVLAVMRQNRLSVWVLFAALVAEAALVLAVGGLVLTQLVVRPLQTVERAAQQVSMGDLNQRVAPEGPREIASLAEAFNRMTSSVSAQREQLIRTEKLASIGQLAAGVAHEIGNPLAAILGYVDILRTDAAGEGTGGMTRAERHDALGRVKGETQRIHRIIQDLLAYSRPRQEQATPTDLHELLAGVEDLLRPQARFRDVRLVRETPPPWPKVMIAPGRLQQVLVNLLINAADAQSGQGRIGVSCTTLDDGRVRLLVADEGPGVPADLARKVFDPFFTTKEPGQGTGLGLSISRAILESGGGTLELEPTPAGERGARFVLTLPMAPSSAPIA